MDAKWKRLKMSNSGSGMVKNLSNADLYQLFAYAMKILPDGGDMFLIYPKSSEFTEPMSDIELSDRHRLSVVPFDLVTGDLGLAALFFQR
jgi:5-methylcytosine-specific restriction enzyme subunit McrC